MKNVILASLFLFFVACSDDSNSDSPNKNPQTGNASLSIQAEGESDPNLVYDFGTLLTRTTKKVSFTITNNSTTAATVKKIVASNSAFYKTQGECEKIEASSTCKMEFAFTPETGGSYASSVSIDYSHGSVNNTVTKNVKGLAKTRAFLKFSQEELSFGESDLSASSTLSVFIENTGETNASDLTLSYPSSPFSLVSTSCSTSLAANTSCLISLSFQSNTVSSSTKTLSATYTDGVDPQSLSIPTTASSTNGSFNQAKGFDESVQAITSFASGEILVGGKFSAYSANKAGRLFKFNSVLAALSGPSNGFNGDVLALKTLPSGKYYVGGEFTAYNGSPVSYLMRFNADGNVDTGFAPVSIDGAVLAIEVDENNKVLVGGKFTSLFSRLNEDGSIDATFNSGVGFVGTSVNAIGQDSLSNLVLAGSFTSYDGISAQNIVRVFSSGGIDPAFDTTTGANGTVLTILMESNDGMYLGGEFTSYKGAAASRIIRLTSNGNKEPLFNLGTAFNSTVRTIVASDADANFIYVGGDFTRYKGTTLNRIAKLDSMGGIDSNFVPGVGFTDTVFKIHKLSDESLLVGGNFKNYNTKGVNHLVRMNSDGILIPTFSENTGANKKVVSSLPLQDGSVLIAGNFAYYADKNSNGAVKLDRHSNVDSSFNVGAGFDSQVNAVVVSPFDSSKFVFAGQFSHYKSSAVGRIVQLDSTGTIDTSFNRRRGVGFNGSVNVLTKSSNLLLCGGQFTTYNGVVVNGIARLTSNGNLDSSFISGSGFNGTVWAAEEAADHSIYVAGDFTSYNGVSAKNLVRLLPDGTLDATFVTGSGFDLPVWTLALAEDSTLYAGGDFTSYNGAPAVGIVKIKTDGTYDTSFNSGSGFNGGVNALLLQGNALYVTGAFTEYQGESQPYLVKLLLNGSKDSSFVSGSGFNNVGSTVRAAQDGSEDVYFGGEFSSYNGVTSDSFVRLSKTGSLE